MMHTGLIVITVLLCLSILLLGNYKYRKRIIRKCKPLVENAMQACNSAYSKNVDCSFLSDIKLSYKRETPKYYMGYNKLTDTLYIVFRGTHGKKGWEENFDYIQVNWDRDTKAKGKWHRGFLKHEFNSVANEIVDWINEYQLKTKCIPFDIVVTGHSKGGSLSLLCGYHLAYLKRLGLTFCNRIIVVAFAPARVCSLRGARAYKKMEIPTIIVKNGNDTVCNVPFRITPGLVQRKFKFFGMKYWPTLQLWTHPSTVFHVGRKWYIALMHLLPFVSRFGNPLDHFPEKYLENVKKWK